jgi:diguanylate cyclase (GGDEF)-like protein
MTLKTTTVRSRVTRRVFGIFAMAALVPAVVTSGFAYYAVEQQLTRKSLDQLRSESKNYALGVFQRLQLARDFLSQTEIEKKEQPGNLDNTLFTRTEIVTQLVDLQNSSELKQKAIPLGGASLNTQLLDDSASIWLSISRSANQGVSAEINPVFLWGSPEMFPATMTFCVLDQHQVIIFCPVRRQGAFFESWRQKLQASSVSTLGWTEGDVPYVAGYFTLPLIQDYSVTGWSVAAIQTKADAMAPMAGFRMVFPPAIGLSVLLALWISLVQVRRRLGPLQVLTSATHDIAEGDFSTEIKLTSDDEFQSLALSLDRMRRDLRRQFGTLRALSELDQIILTATEVQTVVESAVRRMLELFECRCAAITVIDKDAENIGQVIWSGAGEEMNIDRVQLPREHHLTESNIPISVPLAEADAAYLIPLQDAGAVVYQVMPILKNEQLIGIIALGYEDPETLESEITKSLQDFGDRLAVALQTIDRADELYRRAHYDSLTALPNRQLFKDRLERSIAQAIALGHTNALLFIDLDNFKTVNDSEGHSVGDDLLRLAAQRLSRCVTGADTVARLGGDEFTVILSDIRSPHDAAKASARIIDSLSEPYRVETMEHFLGASIGITMIPADGSSVDELLRNADTAMYRAKDAGRGRSVFFEERMNEEAEQRVSLAADLQHAVERNELVLYYQPKVDMETHRVVSAEALLRWMHPTRGFVTPDSFIPLAEETGIILDIGNWVIEEAGRQLSAWQRCGVLENLSLNVSYRQIRDSDVAGAVEQACRVNKLAPETLEVELTESIMADNKQATMDTLCALRNMGVRVAIDDFGTGYSSFSYLTELSFDTLKIDKAFLKDIPANRERMAVLAGIVQIGTLLGKEIVAEGVETPDQATALLKHGCSVAQGYLYSPALTAIDFEAFVSQRAALKLAL